MIQYGWFWMGLPEDEKSEWLHPDHVNYFFQIWEFLVNRAREAAKFAISYRDFHVGCAILAYSEKRYLLTGFKSPAYKIFTGANIKLQPGEGPNIHAEEIAIGTALQWDFDTIVAIVITGETQEDHHSGLRMPTLHPCGRCRTLMKSLSQVKNATILLTTSLYGETCELMEFEELLLRHKPLEKN